jgi:hypothetical protein
VKRKLEHKHVSGVQIKTTPVKTAPIRYGFPTRLATLNKYAKGFGILVERTTHQQDRYLIHRPGCKTMYFASNLDMAAIRVEQLIVE